MIAYRITNLVTGERYIGITKRSERQRFRDHIWRAINEDVQTHLARAIRKYGPDSFRCEAIACARTIEDLVVLEVLLIEQERTLWKHGGYNLTAGGEGRRDGPISPEAIAKRVAKITGQRRTPEQRARISAALKGKPKSATHRESISTSHQGHVRSPESIEKSAAFHRGRKRSAETAARISAGLKGVSKGRTRKAEFCKRGHPRVEGNLYHFNHKASGRRMSACRTCVMANARRHYNLKKGQKNAEAVL